MLTRSITTLSVIMGFASLMVLAVLPACESDDGNGTYMVPVDDNPDDGGSTDDGNDGASATSSATSHTSTADDEEAQGHTAIYCLDADGDSYGDPYQAIQAESVSSGYVSDCSDCDDDNASVHPGATEITDSVDNDCDGTIDEGAATSTWYVDADGDGYGSATSTKSSVTQPSGYVANSTDCNDASSAVNPGASEGTTADSVDNDCDGTVDEGTGTSTYTWYRDADGDGYGTSSTTTTTSTNSAPSGYVSNSTDCNDASSAVNPGKAEVAANSVDDNCNGTVDEGTTYTWYRDADGDGYGTSSTTTTTSTNSAPSGYVSNSADCNDASSAISPSATEGSTADSVDNDCDGTVDEGTGGTSSRVTYYCTVTPDDTSVSWDLSLANTTAGDWSKWFPTGATTSTGTQTESISAKSGDVMYVNGPYGSSSWLFGSTGSACAEVISSLKWGTTNPATTSYTITTATTGADCVCSSNGMGGYNGVCTLK